MGSFPDLLEGIGKGKMDRIIMGKLRMDIDLLPLNHFQEGFGTICL